MAGSCFIHISDIHFGIENRAALAWVLQQMPAIGPDAVICTGDITQRATHRQYAEAGEWFARLGVPLLLEPGNHDMPYGNLVERFRDPFARYRALAAKVAGDPQFSDVVAVRLLTTVSAQWRWPWSDGVIRQPALDRALARLGELQGDPRCKLVLCHHPLAMRELGGENPTIGGDAAFVALARAGADVVLSGHVHEPFDITHEIDGRPIRMIGAGTLSHRLRKAPPSFNILRFADDGALAVETRVFAEAGEA